MFQFNDHIGNDQHSIQNVFVTPNFMFSRRQKPGQAFRPLPSWGPGDPEARRRLLALQHQVHGRPQLHGHDNAAMDTERV